MSAPALEVRGLRVSQGAAPVLDGVDLAVGAGEVVCLLGASGAGKTTLVRAIAGLAPIDAGTVLVGGTDVTSLAPHRRRIGVAFQSPGLWSHLTAIEHAALPAEARGVGDPGEEARRALRRARVPEGLWDRRPGTLSGGEGRRVALARAIAAQPAVLLLDEPFADLETPLREALGDEVRTMAEETGLGCLLVTHLREEATRVGHRVAVLAEKRIVRVGTPDEIRGAPSHPEVARLLGVPGGG